MRRAPWLGAAGLLVPALVFAQAAADSATGDHHLSGSASLYLAFTPDEDVLPIGVLRTDAGSLHFEGRYNYEDRATAALFVGWSFETSGRVELLVTPMLGAVVGRTDGVAPGVELELTAGRFTLYDESEWVIALGDQGEDFLYTWAELTYRVHDWLRPGLTAQRMRVINSDLEVDRGLMVASALGRFEAAGYAFNPFEADRFFYLSVTLTF